MFYISASCGRFASKLSQPSQPSLTDWQVRRELEATRHPYQVSQALRTRPRRQDQSGDSMPLPDVYGMGCGSGSFLHGDGLSAIQSSQQGGAGEDRRSRSGQEASQGQGLRCSTASTSLGTWARCPRRRVSFERSGERGYPPTALTATCVLARRRGLWPRGFYWRVLRPREGMRA